MGTLYRHQDCGMEVFHVEADDSESFFSYSFKTLPFDSTGVFHILEHTVLSGSRRFPAHDPFSLLDAHSCNSYMNALTCPDRTLYPAASPVKKDFGNIFRLYTDSVFAPLLRESDFEGEGIRVGLEGFEGVVFNEMRGSSNQEDSITSSRSKRDLFEGTPYAFSSGGDVRSMVSLTYGEYLSAYRKFYHPSNCRLMLYGRCIDIDEKLDFLEENYLSSAGLQSPVSCADDTPRWSCPREETVTCQDAGHEEGTFIMSFLTEGRSWKSYDNIFISVLVDALLGGPANPLYSALMDSGLGNELCDQSGMSADFNEIPFSVGLSGVPEGNVRKLESFILETLGRIAGEGIGDDILEASIRRQEFLVQEPGGGIPNGLRIFLKCIRGWERGEDLGDCLDGSGALALLRRRLEENSRLFEDWMQENLLDNPHRLSLFVKPVEGQVEEENRFLEEAYRKRSAQAHAPLTDEACQSLDLPLLTLDDVQDCAAEVRTEELGRNILYVSENSCGITYINQVTDLSDLSSDELVYATLLSRYILVAGLEDEEAASFHGRLRLESGGYYAYLETGRASDGEVRAFFVIRIKCLTRQLEKCLSLLSRMIRRLDCNDVKALDDSLNDLLGDYEFYVEESGASYAASLAGASLSPSCSLGEKLMGISNWETVSRLSREDCFSGLARIREHMMNRDRHILHLTGAAADRDHSFRLAAAFEDDFAHLGAGCGGYGKPVEECGRAIWYTLRSSVAYNALALPASPLATVQQEAEAVYANILSNTRLWYRLRTLGGAYGAEASVDSMEEVFTVASYRDPHAGATFDAIRKAMEEVEITPEAVENSKMIYFGRLLRPLSPSQKATLSLRRWMYRIDDGLRERRRACVRGLDAGDVLAARDRLLSRLPERRIAMLAPEDIVGREKVDGLERRTLPSG